MKNDIKSVAEFNNTQEKFDKQKEDRKSWNEIMQVYKELQFKADAIFTKKVYKIPDLKILNKFILLSCYILIPPRRIMDYSHMKFTNY